MCSPGRLFPHPFLLGSLAQAMKECGKKWEFLWDFRRSGPHIYSDITDAYEEAREAAQNWTIIASPENHGSLVHLAEKSNTQLLTMREKYLPAHSLNLQHFSEEFDLTQDFNKVIQEAIHAQASDLDYPDTLSKLGFIDDDEECVDYFTSLEEDLRLIGSNADEQQFRSELKAIEGYRASVLEKFLGGIAGNSLLTELALVGNGRNITVVPYHSHSLHHVPRRKSSDLVLIQPGRISHNYWKAFAGDIQELENLINAEKIRELAIEQLLRKNPLFLRGLNYTQAYFQVVLPRSKESELRPDIIAKPVGSDWWDVIDIKLPNVPILVGRENRLSLSYALSEAAAQLREYSAFFDERPFAKYVQEKYGFKCHKPKLVVIIGRDPSRYTEDQRRRALTAYPNLEVVTYDNLLRSAKEMLLF
jgi:hypothetical protein